LLQKILTSIKKNTVFLEQLTVVQQFLMLKTQNLYNMGISRPDVS